MWTKLYDIGGRKIRKVEVGDVFKVKKNLRDRAFPSGYNELGRNSDNEYRGKTQVIHEVTYICTHVYPHFIRVRNTKNGHENTMDLGDLVCFGLEPAEPPEKEEHV